MTAVTAAVAWPTVSDDRIGERLEDWMEDRAERVENFYDNQSYDVDTDRDGDFYYSPFVNPFYGWGFYGTDVDIDDRELEIDLD